MEPKHKSAAERKRRSRERRKSGYRSLSVDVYVGVVETMIEMDYLQVTEVRDLLAVSSALTKFIEDYAESVTSDQITLNDW